VGEFGDLEREGDPLLFEDLSRFCGGMYVDDDDDELEDELDMLLALFCTGLA